MMGDPVYEPDFPDYIEEFVDQQSHALEKLSRRLRRDVSALIRCNRFACEELERAKRALGELKVANESVDELLHQHNEMKLEVERLRRENASLTITLAGTRDQLKALSDAYNARPVADPMPDVD